MDLFLITYTILFIVVVLVVFIELVSHRVIFANNRTIQKIFGNPLLRYSLRRVGSALISVLLAIIVTFLLIRASVNIDILCDKVVFNGEALTKYPIQVVEVQCAAFRQEMGFAGNVFEQLFTFLYAILPIPKIVCTSSLMLDTATSTYFTSVSGCRPYIMDLGRAFSESFKGSAGQPVPVVDLISERMLVSFPIMLVATALELIIGYPLGVLMAKHKGKAIDKIGNAYIVSVDAIPGVAYYYIWMALLVGLISLPGIYKPDDFLSWLPPVLTIALTSMTGIAFWVRRYMIDEFNSDYVKFARAKGLSENRIMWTHVLRNAIVPLARIFPAAIFGSLLGSFYIESMYQIRGIGGMLIEANATHDIFPLQGIVIVSALISVAASLLGDIATAVADPRIRFTKE